MSALAPNSRGGKASILTKSPNDVVIVSALRTPVTKARKGGLKDVVPDDLLLTVFKGIIKQSGIDPKLIEDVAVGTVLSPGGGANIARMAALAAGIPNTAAVNSLNRQCSSGLTSINQIAMEIMTGEIDIGVGAGVESMTIHYGSDILPKRYSDEVLKNKEAEDCLIPMGITSEYVAAQYKITRAIQDAFAATSYQKAYKAQQDGKFKSEIVPVVTKDANGNKKVIDKDDGFRDGVTAESLSKLKPAFDENGSTHAGNASQVSDGAAAVLLARRSVAEKLGLPILGRFVTAVVVGVPPRIMGIGPAVAIPKVLEKTGLKVSDVDIFEINEAFASQAVMSVQTVGIPIEKVNPVGGAIAMGHPLGATGSRQVATFYPEAKRTGAKIGVTSMCIGSGMGMAAVFTNEQ